MRVPCLHNCNLIYDISLIAVISSSTGAEAMQITGVLVWRKTLMVCGVAPQMEQNSPSCQVRHMKGVPLRAGQGIHNQWPNTAANHRAHANEEPLNPLDLCRLTGFQQHAQRKEETAAPTETSTSEKKLFFSLFLPLRSFASSNNIRICSHRNYRTLKTPSWAGRKRWFTLCWFLSRGGGT